MEYGTLQGHLAGRMLTCWAHYDSDEHSELVQKKEIDCEALLDRGHHLHSEQVKSYTCVFTGHSS